MLAGKRFGYSVCVALLLSLPTAGLRFQADNAAAALKPGEMLPVAAAQTSDAPESGRLAGVPSSESSGDKKGEHIDAKELWGLARAGLRDLRANQAGKGDYASLSRQRGLTLPAQSNSKAMWDLALAGMEDLKMARVMELGVLAVLEGIEHFKKSPPDVVAGMLAMEEKLWKIVELVVPAEQGKLNDMKAARETWREVFQNVSGIEKNIRKFHSSGDTGALIDAVVEVIRTAASAISDDLPKVAPWFDALLDLVKGVGHSWDFLFAGQPEEAVHAIFKGAQLATDVLSFGDKNSDSSYKRTKRMIATLDSAMSKLSQTVLEYKRHIVESKLCYKNTISRGRARPHVCREGSTWDGGERCMPNFDRGAECWMPCGKKAGRCPGFCGAERVCCKRGYSKDPKECRGAVGYIDYARAGRSSKDFHQCVVPAGSAAGIFRAAATVAASAAATATGALKPVCNQSSAYSERDGSWCLARCPEGFQSVGNNKCQQLCGGRFPADSKGICGTDAGELPGLVLQAYTSLAVGGIKLYLLAGKLKEDGFLDGLEDLGETWETMSEMAKPFARPMCPLPAGFVPVPDIPQGVFEVRGSGEPLMNGLWERSGSWRDRPRFARVDDDKAVMEWSQGRMAWRMFYDTTWLGRGRTTLFENSRNSLTVPVEGWAVAQGGQGPAPEVRLVPQAVAMSDAGRSSMEDEA